LAIGLSDRCKLNTAIDHRNPPPPHTSTAGHRGRLYAVGSCWQRL